MYEISVIIPALNEERRIKRLFRDLERQKGVKTQIILADAGSTDKTREIAKKYNVKVKIEAEECGEGFEEHITTKNGKPIYSSQDMPEHKCIFCKNKQLIPSNSNLDDEECYECEKYGFGDELTKIVKEKIEIIKKQK